MHNTLQQHMLVTDEWKCWFKNKCHGIKLWNVQQQQRVENRVCYVTAAGRQCSLNDVGKYFLV